MDNATDCMASSLFETTELEELNGLNNRVISEKTSHSFSLSFKRRLTIISCCVDRYFRKMQRILFLRNIYIILKRDQRYLNKFAKKERK